ncbi:MAG: M23 family metallopeptidase, partial [bacterium]|nr:M23 family metallopeptidase [bacterium]
RVEPYAIIDSEFNDLFGATPDSVLPSGTQVMIPGGEAEQISWNPVVERVPGAGGQNSGGGQISFSPSDPGSCGLVDNPGGGGGWVNPLGAGSYQWIRGFSSWHTAVDLARSEGSPIFAANGGTVVFAGWNSFGYGYLVVLAHGPFTTLYGHMSSINVGCGQYVSAGQVVGAVGNTGNSSGPHLHFEVRYNDIPQDPTTVMAL